MPKKRKRAPKIDTAYEPKSKFYAFISSPKFWEFKKYPGMKFNNRQCQTCIYRSADQNRQDQMGIRVYCDFIYFTERMRGCPPSPHCTKYVKGKRLNPSRQFNPHHQAGFSNTIDEPPFARLKRFSK